MDGTKRIKPHNLLDLPRHGAGSESENNRNYFRFCSFLLTNRGTLGIICIVVNKGVEVLDRKVREHLPCVFLFLPLFTKI